MKEDIQMAEQYMKRFSTPYVIRKVQFFLIECFIDFRSVGNNYLYLCFIFHLTGRKDKCYIRDFSLYVFAALGSQNVQFFPAV